MNKKRIDDLIPRAYEELKTCHIANTNNEIEKTFRGQISSFGAAITMGSLRSAVAFFSNNGSSITERSKLIIAIYSLVKEENDSESNLFDYVTNHNDNATLEKIIDAVIALKLAMNMFKLVKEKDKNQQISETGDE